MAAERPSPETAVAAADFLPHSADGRTSGALAVPGQAKLGRHEDSTDPRSEERAETRSRSGRRLRASLRNDVLFPGHRMRDSILDPRSRALAFGALAHLGFPYKIAISALGLALWRPGRPMIDDARSRRDDAGGGEGAAPHGLQRGKPQPFIT